MIKFLVLTMTLSIVMLATAIAAELESQSTSMSFDDCLLVKERTITQLNVPGYMVKNIVNTADLQITKICTDDGSVIISCSKPDRKMVVTKSPYKCQ